MTRRYAVLLLVAASVLHSSVFAADLGKGVYEKTCIVCHGEDGKGAMPGVPDITGKNGPLTQTDTVLMKRMTEGFQSPGSPMAMPPRGGEILNSPINKSMKSWNICVAHFVRDHDYHYSSTSWSYPNGHCCFERLGLLVVENNR